MRVLEGKEAQSNFLLKKERSSSVCSQGSLLERGFGEWFSQHFSSQMIFFFPYLYLFRYWQKWEGVLKDWKFLAVCYSQPRNRKPRYRLSLSRPFPPPPSSLSLSPFPPTPIHKIIQSVEGLWEKREGEDR